MTYQYQINIFYHSKSDPYFLNGVVTGSEWLRFCFITSGFSRICGPSDDFVVGRLSGRLGAIGEETVDGTGGLIDGE